MTNKIAEHSGVSLHVRCHDLGMFVKVQSEGITLPPAFSFDNLEGYAVQ